MLSGSTQRTVRGLGGMVAKDPLPVPLWEASKKPAAPLQVHTHLSDQGRGNEMDRWRGMGGVETTNRQPWFQSQNS